VNTKIHQNKEYYSRKYFTQLSTDKVAMFRSAYFMTYKTETNILLHSLEKSGSSEEKKSGLKVTISMSYKKQLCEIISEVAF
jgi:hypothetical protein